LRLFFALWPDADARERVANAAAALRLGGDARPLPRENYHVTLAFVGEVPPSRLAVLQQIGRAQRFAGCVIRFDAYDYWPDPQVAVLLARTTPAPLLELWTRLHRDLALHAAGSNPECPHSLRTHITLAREVAQAPVLPAMSPFSWRTRSFSLVHSPTRGAGSVYTVVDTWPLLDK